MSDLKGKRLLILGGSKISCEIVRKAKAMGVYTMVTDWYPTDKSPAKKIADKSFMTSTTNIPELLKLIKENKVDGILTGFTDSTLPHYAKICKAANLPCYGTEEQFNTLIDKKVYKEVCKNYNIPIVDEFLFEPSKDSIDTSKITFPVLVKPSDSSGAKGVTICNEESQFSDAYEKALSYSEKNQVIVEKYINGKEVTIFYLLKDGEIYLTGMGNRHVKHNQDGVIPLPVAYTFPSVYLDKYKQNTDPKVKRMFKDLGLKNGMVFMQCLIEEEEAIIYDIGYRLTGTLEYKLMEEIYGYNPLKMLINFALTGRMTEESTNLMIESNWNKYACNVSFLVKPGEIARIDGLERIKEFPEVIDAVIANDVGAIISEELKGTLRQIVLRVFAVTDDKDHLEIVLDKIYKSLKVVSTDGEDLLLPGFNTQELDGLLK